MELFRNCHEKLRVTRKIARKTKENVLSVPRNIFKTFVKFNLRKNGINGVMIVKRLLHKGLIKAMIEFTKNEICNFYTGFRPINGHRTKSEAGFKPRVSFLLLLNKLFCHYSSFNRWFHQEHLIKVYFIKLRFPICWIRLCCFPTKFL